MNKDFFKLQKDKTENIFIDQLINNEMNLEIILNIQKEINIQGFGNLKNFFSETKFSNKSTEKKYKSEVDHLSFLFNLDNNKFSSNYNLQIKKSFFYDSEIITNVIFIIGYLISLLYLFFGFFSTLLICLCFFFFILTLCIILVSYNLKRKKSNLFNQRIYNYFDQALIF